ncbi:MAG: hypothetical protein QOJ02_2137 [Acidobacteriota bacterium]|nr:hypothetical protein [Acidobacteriota bacterium]
MNLSSRTAMLITLLVGLSYAWAVAYCVVKYESSAKIAKTPPVVTTHRLASPIREPMSRKNAFIRARLHKSGYYFFCPHCSLSFPHPPHLESFYRIGYGWCWYCARWTPIEGGDRKGIVRVDEQGELYTDFYEAIDRDREMEQARWVRELCGTKPSRRR